MRFGYLANVLAKYGNETSVKSPNRSDAAFRKILSDLAIQKIELARLGGQKAVSGASVSALLKAHQQKIDQQSDARLVAKRRAVEAEIEKLRNWIRLQGLQLDKNDNIQWSDDKVTAVTYDMTLVKQGASRLYLSRGLIFRDPMLRERFDTSNMVTHFSGPGYAIYVMSGQGNIHSISHEVGSRHHSSILGGGLVAGAGEMKVTDGRLNFLSNKSGHYQPNPDHLLQTIHILDKAGINHNYEVLLTGPMPKRFNSVDELMAHFDLTDQFDYEWGKLFLYEQHFTTHGDAMLREKNWAWRTDAVTQKHGFYTLAGRGQMVPHKEVRQWFKSKGLNLSNAIHNPRPTTP